MKQGYYEQSFLRIGLQVAIVDELREQQLCIVDAIDIPWEQRAEQIKELALTHVNTQFFRDVNAVERWFVNEIRLFKERLRENFGDLRSAVVLKKI